MQTLNTKRSKFIILPLLLVVFLTTLWNCKTQKPAEPLETDWAAGNRRMAKILKEHSDKADFFKLGKIVINDRAVIQLRDMIAHPDKAHGHSSSELRVELCKQLLEAGQTDDAISEINSLKSSGSLPPQFGKALQNLLALCYLRKGEQVNCISNHTNESCLYPIKGKGIYSIQEPTRKALELYAEILQSDPMDMLSRWLLNIGYMTLGIYPDSVPKQWLVDANHFDSKYPLPIFPDVAPFLGLDARNLAGGVVMDDFNNDGNLDLLITQEAFDGQTRLFMNDGKGKFVEKTKEAGLEGNVAGRIVATADYDNDGFVDVFITRGAWMLQADNHWPCSLMHNNGDGTFSDVTEKAGMLGYHPTAAACWADVDHDGYVDLFVTNESQNAESIHPCQLWHNNHDGTFTDIAHDAGVDVTAFYKCATLGDYDNDGWPDLYISNLRGDNVLFHNDGNTNGHVHFTNVTEKAGVKNPQQGFPTFFFDFNNDGWLDLFASDWPSDDLIKNLPAEYMGLKPTDEVHGHLYLNNHDGTFSDVTEKTGLDRIIFAMSMGFGDLDNDGFKDMYAGTGNVDLRYLFPNLMFRNNNGETFQDVTAETRTGHLQKGHGIAFGDIDNDGDQDVFSIVGGALAGDAFQDALYLNPGNKNHWVTLKLEGKQSNRAAIGSRIKVTVKSKKGSRDIYTQVQDNGTFGTGPLQQSIGLGDATGITSIEVIWPTTGKTQTFSNVAMDQFYHLTEGADNTGLTATPRTKIMFDTTVAVEHHHMEGMKMP